MRFCVPVMILMIVFSSGCIGSGGPDDPGRTSDPDMSAENSSDIAKGPEGSPEKYRGLWLPFLRETENAAERIEDLKRDGVNTVAIGIRLCAGTGNGSVSIAGCEDEAAILEAISSFHRNGIRTIVMPNPAHGDFGISPYPAEYTGREILKAIEPIIIKWAGISEQYGVEMICPVNEPALLAGREDISTWAQEILSQIKDVYSGKTAFRVHNNGDDYPSYRLEGYDYVMPYVTHCSKDVERGGGYLDNMKKINRNNIRLLKEKYPGHEYIFFEVGAYTGPDHYWWEPIAPANMENNSHGLEEDFFVVSPEGQAECLGILFNIGWEEAKGYLVNTAKGFEVFGRPAEAVIREWYAGGFQE